METVAAKLRFQKYVPGVAIGEEWGEIRLLSTGQVRLHASDELRGRLFRTADRVDRAALMYGATAFMGVAALGTTLVLKRKTVWGYLCLLLAGLLALGGSGVRTAAKSAPRLLDRLFDASEVVAEATPEGGFTLTLPGKPFKNTTIHLQAGEFNPTQAAAFLAALRPGVFGGVSTLR